MPRMKWSSGIGWFMQGPGVLKYIFDQVQQQPNINDPLPSILSGLWRENPVVKHCQVLINVAPPTCKICKLLKCHFYTPSASRHCSDCFSNFGNSLLCLQIDNASHGFSLAPTTPRGDDELSSDLQRRNEINVHRQWGEFCENKRHLNVRSK